MQNEKTNDEQIVVKIKDKSFNVEAFFIDLDGTTLDISNDLKISKQNYEAIKEKNRITPVIISTGRSYGNTVKNLMTELDIPYAICQNGSVIVDNKGEVIKSIEIDKEKVQKIIAIAKAKKLGIVINSEWTLYVSNWFMAPFWLIRKTFKRISKINMDRPFYKIVLAGKTKKKIYKIMLEIKKEIKDVSITTSAKDRIIEITNIEATKGKASSFVAKLLNVDVKKCVHIGDSQNDSSTVNTVGALIAMENASQHLLNVATHIGPHYKKGGISKVLNGQFFEIVKQDSNIEKKD